MFSKINNSINYPTDKANYQAIVDGTNKAGTACTVVACKSPKASGDCVLM